MEVDIAVIGGGPAGLSAAEAAAEAAPGARIAVFEAKPSLGRKLLMAGKSGLNITNAEPVDAFLARYRDGAPALTAALDAFPPDALRAWMAALGQTSFVGSSGRVFPSAMKASPLLRAWIARLTAAGVDFRTRWRWLGRETDEGLRFATPDGETRVSARAVALALGGASWPRLGADGAWAQAVRDLGATVEPFRPSNIGWEVAWSAPVATRLAGAPLKPVALLVDDRRLKGELMITGYGLEGAPIYAATPDLLAGATAALDLAPDRSLEALTAALERPRGKQSLANWLRKAARLDAAKLALLRETTPPTEPQALARRIKAAPLALSGPRPLKEGISTAGGLAWAAVDDALALRAWPGAFAAGEMLAWDAPTGGYLLTACFALGRRAGLNAARHILERNDP